MKTSDATVFTCSSHRYETAREKVKGGEGQFTPFFCMKITLKKYPLETAKRHLTLLVSSTQCTVKCALCVQPILEEQWAATGQHPDTDSRFLASTSFKGTDWRQT